MLDLQRKVKCRVGGHFESIKRQIQENMSHLNRLLNSSSLADENFVIKISLFESNVSILLSWNHGTEWELDTSILSNTILSPGFVKKIKPFLYELTLNFE